MKLLKAAYLCSLLLLPGLESRAQGLPPLTVTRFGAFARKDETSIVDNDPGTDSSYSIIGGGNELWGPADKGVFGYFPTTGDFDVRVRVDSLEAVHRYAKTGIMVREILNSTSRMVSLFATPTGPTALPTDLPADQRVGEDTVEFNFRRAGDGSNSVNLGSPGYPNAWLRLARRGNIFYGMIGRDGINWTVSSSVDSSTWLGGAFKQAAFLGLGSSSHDDSALVHSELRQFGPVTSVGPIQILKDPENSYGLVGSTVKFSVGLNDPVDATYQWFAGDSPITGATGPTYTTPRLTQANDQTHYKVTVTGRNGTATSKDAVLTMVSIPAPANPFVIYDFDDGEVPIGTKIFGTATVDPVQGFGGSAGLVLVPAANNQNGSFVVEDFNQGTAVDGFTLAFKLKIGPGSAKPSDGFSVSFGNNIPTAIFPAPQQGIGPGLAVSFDIYDNGDFEAPAIDVFYGVDPANVPQNLIGNVLHKPLPVSRLVTSRFVDVIIRMNPDGKLDLVYDGEVMAYHLQTAFLPVTGGRFGFGAYAGGQNAFEGIDNIAIETSTVNTDAYLSSISPLGNNVSAATPIKIELVDQDTAVDPNSITLQFNDVTVTPVITKNPDTLKTTITYTPPALLDPFSDNKIVITWSDNAGHSHSNTATFKVGNYVTFPTSAALPLNAGVASDSGFKVHIYQIDTHLTETSTFAEEVLAGTHGPNIADTTIADEHGNFVDPSVTTIIDYDVNAAPLGFSTFPGIPGLTDSKENFVGEITTYIQFPHSGYYQMGVRSDDGFKLTTGDPGNPLVVGAFEGAREPFDTIFGFVVPQAGVYPFRLLYYQGGGGAALRWFSINDSGAKILINDPGQSTALKAFRSVSVGGVRPQITFAPNGANLVLTWSGGGVLESSASITSGWQPVSNATSPYPAPANIGVRFFRVRQ